ncbi:MAG: DUF177 domain-containing protein [Acidobacteria bacterium]|nr:DUF177 domain-containing protein [Acidobacteriota bacterium]
MFIEIEDLDPEPLHVRQVYEPDGLPFRHDDAFLAAPVSADFVLTHDEKELHVEGRVETALRYVCSRCLGEYSRPLASAFQLSYLPQPAGIGRDEEIELREEDLEVGFYDGVRLDVDLMVLEQIELSIPMKFVCRHDCRGLCASCGANLNEGSCRCKTESSDPRLAVLLEFRKKMDQ